MNFDWFRFRFLEERIRYLFRFFLYRSFFFIKLCFGFIKIIYYIIFRSILWIRFCHKFMFLLIIFSGSNYYIFFLFFFKNINIFLGLLIFKLILDYGPFGLINYLFFQILLCLRDFQIVIFLSEIDSTSYIVKYSFVLNFRIFFNRIIIFFLNTSIFGSIYFANCIYFVSFL